MRFISPRVPPGAQRLKTFQVPAGTGLDAFHIAKGAKLRASGPVRSLAG
jgi:hypothetical protein